jgi:enoyl-CoA hydratase/carnithine racemase
MQSDFASIQYHVRAGAAWITLQRPRELNAINLGLLAELASGLALAETDTAARAVVITAGGDKAFCAGADLKQVLEPQPAGAPDFLDVAARTFDRLRKFPKPTIAAVNGVALAGGLELVLACDLVVAAETARFGDAHANFGVFPGAGGAAVLPKRIGAARAKYLLFTGEHVGAAEMLAAGLVNQVVPPADLVTATEALVAKIAAKSPLVLRRMKEVADAAQDQTRDAALRQELLTLRDHLRSLDLQEGLAAFREKRAPSFVGR